MKKSEGIEIINYNIMSLGWQTESALLPKSSKRIKVDDGNASMLALKAFVYKKEKEQKANATENHRSRVKLNNNSTIKKVHKNDNDNNNDHSNAALKAKAHLYDQLSRGQASQCGDAFLINFDDKKLIHSDEYNEKNSKHEYNEKNNEPDDDYIEITDHFGRTRRLNKNSSEYDDYKLAEELKNKKSNLQLKRRRFQGDINNTESSSSSKWQWSRGENHSVNHEVEYINNEQIRKAYQDVLDDRIEQEISKGAKVKTKWDETLDSSAKQYIHDIHKEESIFFHSNQSNVTNNSKEDRRALLLIKQQQKKMELESIDIK